MNVFKHELGMYFRSALTWTLVLAAITVFYMLLFPGISQDAQGFTKAFQGYPEPVRQALGLSLETFTSIMGFYTFTLSYLTLCGAIQAMNLGTSLLSKEIRDKTADFLLTKPISRTKIITAKIMAALTLLAFTNLVLLITTFITLKLINAGNFNNGVFLLLALTLFMVQLIFAALGVLISVLFPRIKSVIAVSLTTVFTFFIIGMLTSGLNDPLRYLTPFKYFNYLAIIRDSAYETPYVLTGGIFIVVALIVSYLVYNKRDIHAI